MWSKGDTHAGPSNLKYGLDNRIWGAVGYAGFRGGLGSGPFRMGVYRFDRAMQKMQFATQYSNNTWGLGLSETGEIFGSTANGTHHMYTAIADWHYRDQGLSPRSNRGSRGGRKIDAHTRAHPITDKIRQVDVHGGYTAAAGQNLYTARAYPKKYWNAAALVCEPTMHTLHQGFLKRDGSGWVERGDGMNLVASADEWFAPVHAEVGPDGAVWLADWYNFIIQHNPTPNRNRGGFDAKNGRGNAHENPLRDTGHGRIYRVVWKKAPPQKPLRLDPSDGQQLVSALRRDNMFWRLTAQRLLVQRGRKDVVPSLVRLIREPSVDAIGIDGGAIHALWTLHGLGAIDSVQADSAVFEALQHPSAPVRKAAAQVLPRTGRAAAALAASGVLADPDLNTRLRAWLVAARMAPHDAIGSALHAQSGDPAVRKDPWLPEALRIAAAAQARPLLLAMVSAGEKRKVPGPESSDGPPERKNGTSDPNSPANSCSRSIVSGFPPREFRTMSIAAASLLPPPRPAPCGMRFSKRTARRHAPPVASSTARNPSLPSRSD